MENNKPKKVRKTMHLKPKEGLLIRKLDKKILAKEGEIVLQHSYWLRRVACGDCVLVKSDSKVSGQAPQNSNSNSKGDKK